MTNDQKVIEYKKREIFRYLIIISSILVIILESLALFKVISYVWGIIPFIINCIAKYFYEKGNNKKEKTNKKSKR